MSQEEEFISRAKAAIRKTGEEKAAKESAALKVFSVKDIIAGTKFRKRVPATIGDKEGVFIIRPFDGIDISVASQKAEERNDKNMHPYLMVEAIIEPKLTVEQFRRLPGVISTKLATEIMTISGGLELPLEMLKQLQELAKLK